MWFYSGFIRCNEEPLKEEKEHESNWTVDGTFTDLDPHQDNIFVEIREVMAKQCCMKPIMEFVISLRIRMFSWVYPEECCAKSDPYLLFMFRSNKQPIILAQKGTLGLLLSLDNLCKT